MDVEPLAQSFGERISLVHWRFFQLYEYHVTRIISSSFITIKPEELFDIKFADGSSIRKMISKMQSDSNLFAVYMSAKMGYRWLFQ